MTPVYLKTGLKKIKEKKEKLLSVLESCNLCPRGCGVNRTCDERGYCNIGKETVVASYQKHFGEEAPLVGKNGSGTIFFSGCNLLCSFCQNHDISHEITGFKTAPDVLSSIMLKLADAGCHNINFVTPTHIVHDILSAIEILFDKGIEIPLVYNSSGYESLATLDILDGIIDIYMPDFKFMDEKIAEVTCDAKDYPQIALAAIKEMQRQVGDLQVIDGIAQKGLIIRHLVLPNDVCNTKLVMKKIRDEISENAFVNIMPQYRPLYKANNYAPISRRITDEEFNKALRYWEESSSKGKN